MENVNNESTIGIVKISDEVVSVIAEIAANSRNSRSSTWSFK